MADEDKAEQSRAEQSRAESGGRSVVLLVLLVLLVLRSQCSSGRRGDGAMDAGEDAESWGLVLMLAPVNNR